MLLPPPYRAVAPVVPRVNSSPQAIELGGAGWEHEEVNALLDVRPAPEQLDWQMDRP
jgi:hypothetical protein